MNEFQDCGVYCLDCFNQIHSTHFKREQVVLDHDAPCHRCGQRPVAAWTPPWSWRERLLRGYSRVEDLAWRLSDWLRERTGRRK